MEYPRFEAFIRESFPQVTEAQLEMFRDMEPAYRDWNSKINVISRKDIDGLYDHHILHSLAIAEYLKERRPSEYQDFMDADSGLKVLDLGTGWQRERFPPGVSIPGLRTRTSTASSCWKSNDNEKNILLFKANGLNLHSLLEI